MIEERQTVERELLEVYNFCPPTKTFFRSPEAHEEFKRGWGDFFARLGAGPASFAGRRVLDLGCGSCEKAALYSDWGAKVTGVDMTGEVLALGRQTIGSRNVELIQSSLFDFNRPESYDIVVIDGVSFITADTFAALAKAREQLKPGGTLIFSLTNVWGRFWWFRYARRLIGLLGGNDFHQRAAWGRRLFLWTRRFQEGTGKTSAFFRSNESWAYDWFGPPAYHLHSPPEILQWLDRLGLEHTASLPSLLNKESPRNLLARMMRALCGRGPGLMKLYWLLNREPNMVYVSAVKTPSNGANRPTI